MTSTANEIYSLDRFVFDDWCNDDDCQEPTPEYLCSYHRKEKILAKEEIKEAGVVDNDLSALISDYLQ
jgi:hypothetical protein